VLLNFTNAVAVTNSVATNPPAITVAADESHRARRQLASFSVTATGSPPLFFQWYFNSNAISSALNPTAITPTLSLQNAQGSIAGFFHVIITNSFGAVTSIVVTLTVTNSSGMILGTPPTIHPATYRSNRQ